MRGGRVIVVGSVNLDVIMRCDHLPRRGETVLAGAVSEDFGGKGANQAVAAARLGASTQLIAAVGDDAPGAAARADLAAWGVDTTGVVVVAGQPTGRAVVLVDRAGENAIVVASGANAALDPATVAAQMIRLRLRSGDVVLVSGEVPAACGEAAVRACADAWAHAVCNLAPFRGIPEWMAQLRPLVVPQEDT